MEASVRTRSLALLAVLAIHLLFVAVLIDSSRQRDRLPGAEPTITAFIFNPAASAPAEQLPRARSARRQVPASPAMSEPALPLPSAVTEERSRIQEPTDWLASAHQAARDVLAAEAIEAKRNARMGAGWWLAQEAKHHRFASAKSFPWSRQPRRAGVDIDPNTFLVTFTLNERCQVVLFLIVPGFGCALGHLNPEPGRSDLFDPKFLSPPLELAPAADVNLAEPP
jgi:hypothetical protein